MSEDTSSAQGKDVHQLQKGQIIDLHQAKITTKEIETTEELSDAWKTFGPCCRRLPSSINAVLKAKGGQ